VRVIEKVTVGKRGDGSLIRVESQAKWFSVICVRGKQYEISTGTPDLKLAKRFHRQKLDELAADRQGPGSSRLPNTDSSNSALSWTIWCRTTGYV
jgi:hypothetical protein